eukprot:CAMPEP_0118650658 /NCGR_PEP_ID=MMETSP0785-20121206/10362_1 /TAXON_ID=91992 /ORGANISM="Bolidomonas pacifica, Strain CCMP 1866" /LENGTH=181 /DNA_ID=CAMNT_0006543043 /DNA_START=238 /DNA_END=780 /DNA_ORIENTATION=+
MVILLATTNSFILPLRPFPQSCNTFLFSQQDPSPRPRKRLRKDRKIAAADEAPPVSPPPESPIVPPSSLSNSPPPPPSPPPPRPSDDISNLLVDAEKFRSQSARSQTGDEAMGEAIGQTVKGVISNIVVVDFFFILAFLAWFLAGVISSTFFKNDAIQLAFNGIFQPIVQPALGILMIGSL